MRTVTTNLNRARAHRAFFAVALLLAVVTSSVIPGLSALFTPTALAAHTDGGSTSAGHKGPDPNCAFQDKSGRGGYGPRAKRGKSGKSGHSDGHTDEGDHSSGGVHTKGGSSKESDGGSGEAPTDTGSGIIGGGAGGEGYVCDGPGSWSVESKVLRR